MLEQRGRTVTKQQQLTGSVRGFGARTAYRDLLARGPGLDRLALPVALPPAAAVAPARGNTALARSAAERGHEPRAA